MALFMIFALLAANSPAVFAQAQQAQESKEEKKLREAAEKKKKQEQERQAREEKAKEKGAKQYASLLEFGQDQYNSKPEFKDDVDKAYLDLQGQHAMQAYQINTQRNTELVYGETEDASLKIRRVFYDNPWVQDYVNRVGQRLVPKGSDKLYAFKVTYHPIPYAYTLSTGTILISTGMISMLDNEAQLAYVLSHELAHVYKDHWKTKIMMGLAAEEYNKQQAKKAARWAMLFGAVGAAVGGASARSADGAIMGGTIGGLAGFIVGSLYNRQIGVDWETVQENDADAFAMGLVLDNLYDAKEVPKIYVAMEDVARLDERVQLGFLGHRPRIRERKEFVDRALEGQLKTRYAELLAAGKLMGSSPDYNLVMAELKRDNGIEAFRFDMFQMARRNLAQAVNLRSDDVRATFYYGRVLRLIGRSEDELKAAEQYLKAAVSQDSFRQNMPEVQLQKALLLMDKKDPASVQALKDYIIEYQRKRVEDAMLQGTTPPNLETLYDLMRIFGKEMRWEPSRPEMALPVLAPASVGGVGGESPHPAAKPASQGAQAEAPGGVKIENPVKAIKEQIKENVQKATQPVKTSGGKKP
ncbi:MAG: M48 family metalloprotease [Blastocatellia bacterium]|nr:M48 family metalloprotease [Blastocatellia bacterium]